MEVTNACGLKNTTCTNVQIKTEIPDSVPILGKTAICEGEITTYGVAATNVIGYTWLVPAGATIVGANGSPSVQVNWGTSTGGRVLVELKNACNLTRFVSSQNITVEKAEPAKPTLSGANTACPSTNSHFSIQPDPSFKKITWLLSNGNGTIRTRTDSTGVSISWNTTGITDVCVEVESNCGVKKRECLPVSVKNALDSLSIEGLNSVCLGDTLSLSVTDDPDVSGYFWRIPTGATIVKNERNRINVRFVSGTGGAIFLTPIGGCADGTRSTKIVQIKPTPQSPTSIEGRAGLCEGTEAVYTALGAINATSYVWTVPSNATVIGTADSAKIRLKWNTAGSEKIRVKAVGACGMSNELTFDVATYAIPKPRAGADTSVCGITSPIQATPSVGTGIWTVLEKPNPNATILFDNASNATTRLTTSVSGIYTLKFEENNNNCIGSDTVKITYKSTPQLTLVDETCGAEATNYRVKATIRAGTAPFTSVGLTTGNVAVSEFLSNPINSGTSYEIAVRDANGCTSDTLRGQKACFCTTFSGTLARDSVVICLNTEGVVRANQNSVLDQNDKEEFILHTGTNRNIGQILIRNTTGRFKFSDAAFEYDKVYYVQKVAGNRVGDTVSLTDRCASISNAVPLIFKNKLTATINGDTTVCANSDANITFRTNQDGRFRIKFGEVNSTTSQELLSVRNGQKLNVRISKSTSYQLLDVTSDAQCKADISDVFTAQIRPIPTIEAGADQTVCEPQVTVSATLPPQYSGTWRSLNGNIFGTPNAANTSVSGLKNGKNTLIFSVQDNVCPVVRVSDTVSIFLPLVPAAKDYNYTIKAGDSLSGELVEKTPEGTYAVTQLDQTTQGYLDVFSKGAFSFVSRQGESGVVKFRYSICTDACTSLCDTGVVNIIIKANPKPIEVTKIDVPNAINAHNDGVNDVLIVDNLEQFKENELIISIVGAMLFIGLNPT
ncbi:MAG: hypothetical protein HC817_13895 [Saprospiraceae bacterium]|nr:hypothetical protein [Saprospiraceae bacterium]